MKLTYFHYYFKKRNQRQQQFHTRFKLNPLLQQFCGFDHEQLKNSFETNDGERIYLLRHSDCSYLFLATRNRDIIKAINSTDFECSDIQEKLALEESVSFASYLRVDKPFYAVAATQKGPKNGAFVLFINQLLQRIGAGGWRFCSEPVFSSLSRSEVVKLPFVGRTTVEVSPYSNLGRLIGSFTKLPNDEVNGYQLVIKPKPGKSFSTPSFIEEIADEGLKRFVVRAKASLDDDLDDFYITAKGALKDLIRSSGDSSVFTEIAERVTENETLKVLLDKLEEDSIYVEENIQDLDRFCDPAVWGDHFSADWLP